MKKTLNDYRAWVQAKTRHDTLTGFEVDERDLNPKMRADQRAITQWALHRGRAAEFIITGGGKALNALEWAHQIARRTDKRVVMFAPLAVADQFVDTEAPKWGYELTYVRNQDEANAAKTQVVISNYELMERFTPAEFSATVWDESSIIKESSSATRNMINRMWKHTPYRLALTATPAPNDHDELGNHAQALGIMPWHEMITRWFIRDSNQADTLRLKGHAEEDFWKWVASWAVCMSKPSDLGFDDAGFILPPLKVEHLEVAINPEHAWDNPNRWGQAALFAMQALSATELHANKRVTLDERMAAAADWANRDTSTPCVVWVERNDEGDMMRELLPDATEVRGDEPFETKRQKLRDFSLGNIRVLITKPAIAGFGMNWQHCHRTVISSMTFSFERTFQLIRRFYRYGQTHEVELSMVSASTEGNVVQALQRKEAQYTVMQAQMNKAMRATGLLAQATHFEDYDYVPTKAMKLPPWLKSQ
jgi:hypothetical protein